MNAIYLCDLRIFLSHSTLEQNRIPACSIPTFNVNLWIIAHHHILFYFSFKNLFAMLFCVLESLDVRFAKNFHFKILLEDLLESWLDHFVERTDQNSWQVAWTHHVQEIVDCGHDWNVSWLKWVCRFVYWVWTVWRVEDIHDHLRWLLPVHGAADNYDCSELNPLFCNVLNTQPLFDRLLYSFSSLVKFPSSQRYKLWKNRAVFLDSYILRNVFQRQYLIESCLSSNH